MKRIFLNLFLAGVLVFTLSTAALASNLYFDYWGKGTADTAGVENDLSGLALGLNLYGEKFLANLEYSQNTKETASNDIDMDEFNLKGGYALFIGNQSFLALTAGYHQMKPDSALDEEYSGALVGLEAMSLFERSRLEGSVGYSVSGTYKKNGAADQDLDILRWQVKYSFFITANCGLGVGYKSIEYKIEDGAKTTNSGPTVGVTYKF
jgi:hypothetical protein